MSPCSLFTRGVWFHFLFLIFFSRSRPSHPFEHPHSPSTMHKHNTLSRSPQWPSPGAPTAPAPPAARPPAGGGVWPVYVLRLCVDCGMMTMMMTRCVCVCCACVDCGLMCTCGDCGVSNMRSQNGITEAMSSFAPPPPLTCRRKATWISPASRRTPRMKACVCLYFWLVGWLVGWLDGWRWWWWR